MGQNPNKKIEKLFSDPIFHDIEKFLECLDTYTSILGGAHIVLPKRGFQRFIDAAIKKGFVLTPFNLESSEMFNRNTIKKLRFYEVTRNSDSEVC